MTATAVSFRNVDIIFGNRAAEGLTLLDQGRTRTEILAACGAILGVADCSLDVGEGEITVLMGLSGSGKSTLMRAVNGLNRPIRGKVEVRDGEAMVDVAACDPADTVTGVQPIDSEPVIADQSVGKQRGIIEMERKFRADRKRGFVVVPVVPKIAFKSEVLIEVIGQAGAEALGHVGDLGG